MKLFSGQDWARKFVTFRLFPGISRNETGLLRDSLRSLRVQSLIYSRNVKQRILRGCAETRNFSSSVEKHFTSDRSFRTVFDEFKVTKCCTKTFCPCLVLRSKIAFMRCVTFSNVLYVFGLGSISETICTEMLVFGKQASWMFLFSEYPGKSHNFTT